MGPAGGSDALAGLIGTRLLLAEPHKPPPGRDDAHCSSQPGDARDS
jgi:hypothetical protein